MASIGGPIESMSIRSRLFASAADADVMMDTGGKENSLEMNGDSTGRIVQARVNWKAEGAMLAVDHDRGDLEFFDEVIESGETVPITITFADGTTYQGQGTILGRPEYGAKNATAKVNVGGAGKAEPQ